MPTATKHRARLGDLLISRGLITEGQLAIALAAQQQGQPQRLIGEILVDLGYVNREQVLSAVAEGCGVPFVHLTPVLVDLAARSALPEAFIRKHGVLPLFRVRDMLTVATPEPANLFLVDEIAHASGLSVQFVAASADSIYQVMERTLAEVKELEDDGPEDLAVNALGDGDILVANDFESVYGSWPIEKVAALLVREAIRTRAAALHLEPDEKVLRVRFGIDGQLHVVMRPPARLAASLTGAFEEMMGVGNHGHSSFNARRSGRLMVHGRSVQLHMTSLGGAFGPRVVIRLVRDDEATRPLSKLGCDFDLLASFRECIAPLRGLVVIAGPRASGATTTLYSTLNDLDPIRLNICTFEDSINYSLSGVNQFSPATCGTSDVAAILPRLLLQQIDVLALDCEMNGAVASSAVQAAIDGCLVLAQVRAGDAAEAIARLAAHAAVEDLAPALRGVLCQRLVRTVCPSCRAPYEPPAPLRRHVAEVFGPVQEYVRGRGCPACGRTGLLGQIGLFEWVPIDTTLADGIRERAGREALRAVIRAAGHPSLWDDGIHKVRAGLTSLEEVMKVLSGCPGFGREESASPRAPQADAPHVN
jgi:type IV pilus assembly protein PilB